MKFDLHTHHVRCGHANGTIRDYIEAGITSGLDVIGISDHTPYFGHEDDQPFPNITMRKSEFGAYVDEVLKLKVEYAGRIDVLLGIESDFFPEYAKLYHQTLSRYPFDYIIGSVHHTHGVSIFNKNRWRDLSEEDRIETKTAYYRLIRESAQANMFQILGHIDAMKGNYPAFSDIQTPAAIDQTLQAIAQHGIAIEINTSGKTKLSGGWYPSDDILERALYYAVDVTFGSDAHKPERVGEEWEDVRQRLLEIGFKSWVYFKQKQKQVVALN
ncbi:histidinol-phosphatase [Paenibacillus sp. ACRRX]|uniref:histidinol-phosphatase n=1 Tax=unclassified Paenibacillus TaxID=185978 RepID=UPI001EF4BD56|nr:MULTISPECIES: histidinol-phosphatase [unclassified Paenibacillus]MCG7410543.1 histidinol-phosphatase [Paenibacillus sp. ACRRX]MDK8183968.1 histidinol-phosphatase [Paenibacillus sp. UMB4589-SE434]